MQITNELIHETSPYLRQHADNPVHWYPWGPRALKRARKEDKPIFLSIGYSTCHWCHVMARECFQDQAVAERLNRDFISVKVDREERPDIDGVYMQACLTMTGSGGWPLSLFLTPEGAPFYAGTYFPRPEFLRLLEAVSQTWRTDRERLDGSGKRIAALLSAAEPAPDPAEHPPIQEALEGYRRSFDSEWGGFGPAPKFPAAHNLLFLLQTEGRDMAEATLSHMYRGGLFDHVGGGFCRYATDRRWLVPHFEKMLYDNALLTMAYLLADELTGRPLYRRVAERTFSYLERELAAPGGGFYAAQDADAGGSEGAYYLFTPQEVEQALGAREAGRFCWSYGVTAAGNFEGRSIPNLLRTDPDQAPEDLLPAMYAYRSRRTPPHRDEKILTGWNALVCAAYAMAGRIWGAAGPLDRARELMDFLQTHLTEGEAVFAGITGGRRLGAGFLDDYAFLIFALLQLHQATLDDGYLDRARALLDRAWTLFWDSDQEGFFFSGPDNERLIARRKETWDGALPSGNSVMAYNLSRLALLTDDQDLADRAQAQSRFLNGYAAQHPTGYGFYLWSALPVKKVTCALGDPRDLADLRVRSDWAFRVTKDPAYPLLDGKTAYYVCENGACLPPSPTLP